MGSGASMKIFAVLVCFLVSFLSPWHLCFGDELKKVDAEVVGLVDCFDCAVKKVFPREAFSGIRVTIDCKGADQLFKTRGEGFLNGEGEFRVSLPNEMLENETLMEQCFAHLHSASARLCPPLDGVEAARIVLKSKIDDKYTFGPAGELKLSPAIYASTLLRPHFRHPNIPWFPHGPKFPLCAKHHYPLSDYVPHPWKKKEKPLLPKIPIFRKPLPLPLPLPAPVPLSQKLNPALALKHGMPVKEHGSTVAPVLRKAFPNLPIPKRLHPIGKHHSLHRLRLPIPRIGDMSHP